MILSVTLNPCVDRVLFVGGLKVGDTNRVLRTETDAGGKGVNLSRVAAELGARTMATGFLGGGPGAYVRHVLRKQGVNDAFLEIAEETRINTSIEDGTKNPPTTFNEKGGIVSPAQWTELIETCRRLFDEADWVAIGGSLPPGVPEDGFAFLTRLGHEFGCKVLLDADGVPMKLGLEVVPDLIKPNANEAARLLGHEVESTEQAIQAARELVAQGIGTVILSRGKDGAILATKEAVWNGTSPAVEPRSTIGSGDSMLGAYLWALESDMPPEEALRWGLAAGAATATTNGSEIARRPVVKILYGHARVERQI